MTDNERLNYVLLLAHHLTQKEPQREALIVYLEQFFTGAAKDALHAQAIAMSVWEAKIGLTPTPPL